MIGGGSWGTSVGLNALFLCCTADITTKTGRVSAALCAGENELYMRIGEFLLFQPANNSRCRVTEQAG